MVDDLGVTEADYELTSVDVGGSTGVARYSAAVELDGLRRVDLGRQRCRIAAATATTGSSSGRPRTSTPPSPSGQHLARTREVPERAPILDAAGNPLSVGRPARIIGLEPRAITRPERQSRPPSSSSSASIPPVIDEALNAPGVQPDHFVTITTVDAPRYDQVAPVIYPLPGTRFRDTFLRGGPTPEFAAHVLGSFGEITAERLDELGPPYQVGDMVGLTGLEARYEEQLAGTPTAAIQVVDEDGAAVSERRPVRGAGARSPCAPRSTRRCSRPSRPPSARPPPPPPSSWSTRRATSGPSPRGPSASTTGRSPASTPPVRRSRSSPRRRCSPAASPPTRPSSAAPTVNAGGRTFQNFEASSLGTVPFGLAFAQSCNTAFISAAADVPDPDFVAAAETFGFNTDYSVGLDTTGGSFPAPGRRHRARGRRHRPGTGHGQPAAHGDGRRHDHRRHLGAAGAAARRTAARPCRRPRSPPVPTRRCSA